MISLYYKEDEFRQFPRDFFPHSYYLFVIPANIGIFKLSNYYVNLLIIFIKFYFYVKYKLLLPKRDKNEFLFCLYYC